MSANESRDGYIKGLRALADILEANESLPLPYQGSMIAMTFHYLGGEDARRDMATAVRVIPCSWTKRARQYDDGPAYLDLTGELHGLKVELTAYRDDVCERVVVGTEEREVEEVVQPAVTEKVTRHVEKVEWRCGPIMSALDEPEVPGGAS
jgi:hypothetical protein